MSGAGAIAPAATGAGAGAGTGGRLARLRLAFGFARRELRGSLSGGTLAGFRVFVACIALGVATIGGVGSLAGALTASVADQGRAILGGDLDTALVHRAASPDEHAALAALGPTSTVATLRSMARNPATGDQILVELKAVDDAYPLVGSLDIEGGGDLHALIGRQPQGGGGAPAVGADVSGAQVSGEKVSGAPVWGAVADKALLDRLGLKIGDRIGLGTTEVVLEGVIAREPDKLAGGFDFGPRLMISARALDSTGLVVPGSLITWHERVSLPPGAGDAAVKAAKDRLEAAFPDAGWRLRDRNAAAPGFVDNIARFAQYLTVVGLSALVVGGVGVANAVSAFVERKRASIAALRALGASGTFVFFMALAEVMAIAALGIAIGLVLAAAIPPLAGVALAGVLPVDAVGGLYPGALGLAALYGVLTALAFSLWPLGRVHDVSPTVLFRDADGEARWPRRRYVIATAAVAAALAAIAIGLADDRRIAVVFVAGTIGAFAVLRAVAAGLRALAARAPRARSVSLRLALGNIRRPGALTPVVVLSLGLGLTLLVTLALIDGNMRRELTGRMPAVAPSFFFLDVASTEIDPFRAFLAREAPGATVAATPMLRGRLVSLKGIPAADYPAPASAAWVLKGDRGITFAATPPANGRVSEGEWWPADYAGKPLVSFSADVARDLGLKIGDPVTVNVLGRPVTATIANLRTTEWDSLSINFVMVFSPNTFAGAPYGVLATLTYPGGGSPEAETALMRAIGRDFPTVTAVRVKDALDTINDLVSQLALAIRAAASIALAASVLVLAGALAASHASRIHDAVVLKTLGATRRRLIAAFALEYALLGGATAVFAVAAGSAAAYAVIAGVMRIPFAFDAATAIGAVAVALVVTVGLGLVGTWRVLGHKAGPVLRDL